MNSDLRPTYDYAIIGSGPTGLTLALYLSMYNKKVLIIEKEDDIGGCHGVRRINGLFTEHGPRIVIDNYFSFIDILQMLGLNFNDMYAEYNFSLNMSVKDITEMMDVNEKMAIIYEFIKFMFNENYSRHITMREFTTSYKFRPPIIHYLDDLCRLTDGGTIENYTLFEFLQIFNQNYFYKIYQPKVPNDIGLFKHWKQKLIDNNVSFMFNTKVINIDTSHGNHQVNYIGATSGIINATNYIFAIPPAPMFQIVKNSSDRNMFGNFNDLELWTKKSDYLTYIPIIFHWNEKINTRKIWGFVNSYYSIVYVVMTDYMDFKDDRSKTVVVCTVKATNVKSLFNNKTANECNESELINEVFRQFKDHQKLDTLPFPTYALISPGVYKNTETNEWNTIDTAFFYTKAGYKSNKSSYDNLFWCGCHNGNSNYSFTAMESAIENAISLLHELVPESRNKIIVHNPVTVKKIIFYILFIFCLVILMLYIR